MLDFKLDISEKYVINKQNSFDFLRLLFACFVIITHSYPLSGVTECDWLCQITPENVNLSYFGVRGFFVISGFLIYKSMLRSDNFINYFWKRILRIFPGLIFLLILTFLLVLFLHEGQFYQYLWDNSFRTYFLNNLFLWKPEFDIDGIFENNPYKSVINGSLWTLRYEVVMYFLLSLFLPIRKNLSFSKSILVILFILLSFLNLFYFEEISILNFYTISAKDFSNLSSYFVAGALLATLKPEFFKCRKILLLTSTFLLTFALGFGAFRFTEYFIVPIFVVLLGLQEFSPLKKLTSKLGDLSYGIYIFAFPVQQTLQHFFKLDHINLMWLSMVITFFLAYFSWHYIEVKALKYKTISWRRNYSKNILSSIFISQSSGKI